MWNVGGSRKANSICEALLGVNPSRAGELGGSISESVGTSLLTEADCFNPLSPLLVSEPHWNDCTHAVRLRFNSRSTQSLQVRAKRYLTEGGKVLLPSVRT